MWLCFFLGVPHLDVETNDAIILGYMIAEFLEEVRSKLDIEHIVKFDFSSIFFDFS